LENLKCFFFQVILNVEVRREREQRLKRVLTVDPGIGIARHVDTGYEEAIETAKKRKVKIPGLN
jgi:urocanate hydratase